MNQIAGRCKKSTVKMMVRLIPGNLARRAAPHAIALTTAEKRRKGEEICIGDLMRDRFTLIVLQSKNSTIDYGSVIKVDST